MTRCALALFGALALACSTAFVVPSHIRAAAIDRKLGRVAMTTLPTEQPVFPEDRFECPALSRFLTQRAVQLCIHYCGLNLDETKAEFLTNFMVPEDENAIKLDTTYHGLNGLPTLSSSEYVCSIFMEPTHEVEIMKPMGCAPGRSSGGLGPDGKVINRQKNPYIKPRFFSYWDTFEPAEIAYRLLNIREQVTKELFEDAQLFIDENEAQRIDESFRMVKGSTQFRLQGDNFQGASASSPFRRSNFDLFRLLVTREALVQMISRLSLTAPETTEWLEAFSEPWFEIFNSAHRFERGEREAKPPADEFMIALSEADHPDARNLALLMLDQRRNLAASWRESLLQNAQSEHVDWQRWQMGRLCMDQGTNGECEVP